MVEGRRSYTGLIWLIIIVLAFLFFWFEWRPASIKKSCIKEAGDEAVRITSLPNDTYESDTVKRERLQRGLIDGLYRDCLRDNGL